MYAGRLSSPRFLPVRCIAVPELGRDVHLITERRERLADSLLAEKRTVVDGGVEEGDSSLIGRPDHLDRILLAGPRTVGMVEVHSPEAEGGDLQ
jgi:hypothetical protein